MAARRRTMRWQRLLLRVIETSEQRVQRMSRAEAMRFGVGLGRLAMAAARRPRRIAQSNLALAFGDTLSYADRQALVQRVFQHFGKTAVDFLRGPLLQTREDLDALFASVEGWEEHAAEAVRAGRPVIFCGAHLGNWELQGRWIAAQGVPLTVVARTPEDPHFGQWVQRMREGAGLSVASKGDSARRLLSLLKRGEALGVLPDQNSGDLFVPFFGTPCGTVAGPALFALRTEALLVCCYCFREPDDRYRLVFYPPIPAHPGVGGATQEEDVFHIMAAVNRQLEAAIREYPDQWLWLHHRWKAAFEEKNRARWPEGFSFGTSKQYWESSFASGKKAGF